MAENGEETVSDESELEDYHSANDPDPDEDLLAVKEEDEENSEQNSAQNGEEAGYENRQSRRTRGVLPSRLSDYVVGVVTEKVEEPATFQQAVSSAQAERDVGVGAATEGQESCRLPLGLQSNGTNPTKWSATRRGS